MMPGQIPDPSLTAGALPGLGPLTGLPGTALTAEELKYADIRNIGAMISPLHFLEVKLGKRPQPVKSEVRLGAAGCWWPCRWQGLLPRGACRCPGRSVGLLGKGWWAAAARSHGLSCHDCVAGAWETLAQHFPCVLASCCVWLFQPCCAGAACVNQCP